MSETPRVLLVGAGAVGQVYGKYLQAAGCEISFLVKEKYADEARRGFTLYDHGVFVLYSLTAMSILAMFISILGPLWSGFAVFGSLLATFGVPAHMFAQLKGAYGLSWFSAAWRTLFLLLFCVFAFTLFILAIIMLGLTG